MTDPHKSGSVTRISVKFYTIKGANECMKILVKKNLITLGTNLPHFQDPLLGLFLNFAQ